MGQKQTRKQYIKWGEEQGIFREGAYNGGWQDPAKISNAIPHLVMLLSKPRLPAAATYLSSIIVSRPTSLPFELCWDSRPITWLLTSTTGSISQRHSQIFNGITFRIGTVQIEGNMQILSP